MCSCILVGILGFAILFWKVQNQLVLVGIYVGLGQALVKVRRALKCKELAIIYRRMLLSDCLLLDGVQLRSYGRCAINLQPSDALAVLPEPVATMQFAAFAAGVSILVF